MIGTLLVGGLGNQMFQYAAARALALRHGTQVRLDMSAFGRPGMFAVDRPFDLDKLSIAVRSPSRGAGLSFLLARRPSTLLQSVSGWRPFREGSLSYDPAFEHLPDQTYLFGYWQSWRYFDPFAAQIAQDFVPAVALSARNRELQATMRQGNSLAIHVRRGDYVGTAEAESAHGVMGTAYYAAAVQRLGERLRDVRAFVFSDDIPWCRDALAGLGLNLTFVDWNVGRESWQDMILMSACSHAIIANSSFSWWGGWLGDQYAQNDERSVIAPRQWFVGSELSDSDRCPPRWTLL